MLARLLVGDRRDTVVRHVSVMSMAPGIHANLNRLPLMENNRMLDPVVSVAFSVYSSPGIYALLLGSGVSRSAGIPTGWEVVQELIRNIALLENATAEPSPVEWYRLRFSREPSYSEILSHVAPTASERRNVLRRFFESDSSQPGQPLKAPSAAHKAIADLVVRGFVRVVVTTNFDRLLETALTSAGASFQVVSTPDAIAGMQPLSHAGCTVVKVNGDYLDARLRNTLGELRKYDAKMTRLLDRICDEFGMIVCGWSADWDAALRAVLQRRASRRYSIYWTVRTKPSPLTEELIQLSRAITVPIASADDFFPSLLDRVAALRVVRAPHPLSPQMAVASLKAFIEDRRAIKLSDLFSVETERLFSELGEADLLVAELPLTAETLRQRLNRYEAAAKTLVALVAQGCYWSDENRETYLRAIQRIANPPGAWKGSEIWLNMRRYPGLLLLYAAGMSAVLRNNFGLLRSVLMDVAHRDVTGQKSAALDAMLAFKVLEPTAAGLLFPPRRKTPWSEILHDALRDAFRGLLPEDEEYSMVFDRFEGFVGLIWADVHADKAWAPFGRFAWRRENGGILDVIRSECETAGDSWPPFREDLFGRSRDRFEKALKKVADIANRVASS